MALSALAAMVLSLPVVTWWLIGDLSEEQGEDYLVQAPDLPTGVDVALVLTAVLSIVFGTVLLGSPAGRRPVKSAELKATVPLVLLGVFVGAGGRVLTARVVGANIGGGLVMLVASVVLPLLIIWSAAQWSRITGVPT